MSEPVGDISQYPFHGLNPSGAVGTAKVFFIPSSKRNLNLGGWKPVDIRLELE
jgi:hypothetical protein